MNLKKQTFSGVRWTTFSSLGRATLQIAQVAILARFLEPTDFGLVAIVFSVLAMLQIFSDAGVSNAIIHYQDISQNQLSSLYWLNVIASFILALLLSFVSPLLSAWYHEPEIKQLLHIAALAMVITALGQQIRVLAQKRLLFSDLAKVELLAAFFGFIVTVSLASLGAGVYSLVVGNLVTSGVACVLCWLRLSGGWRPQLRFRIAEIHKFIRFGVYMVGNNLANTFNSQIDVLLGGSMLGSQSIGLYSVPKDLSLRIAGVINPIVTQVGLPVMAQAQDDNALLKRIYLQTMRMTASVNFPIYVAMGVFAPEIVYLMLGQKWHATIPLLQLFAIWALVRSTGNPVGSLLMAKGRADLSFRWNLMWLFVMPPSIWVGHLYGTHGLAVSMVGLGLIGYLPNWFFLVRPLCGAGLGEYSIQLAVPLVLSLVAGVLGYTVAEFFGPNLYRLIIGVFTGTASYFFLSYFFNNSWFQAMGELISSRFSLKATK